MDSSLKSLIQQVLPVCSLFVSLSSFVEKHSQYQYGLTFHAFCESIKGKILILIFSLFFEIYLLIFFFFFEKDILNDFVDVVIQMESLLKRGKLTAQVFKHNERNKQNNKHKQNINKHK